MKKQLLVIYSFLMLSCGSETVQNDCFHSFTINETINLVNPEFNDLQVPGGYAITELAGRNIIIIRRNSQYKAFDLECPEKDCNAPMTFDGLKIQCTCSKKEYNSLNGSPIDGNDCFALEYNIIEYSSNTLQITR